MDHYTYTELLKQLESKLSNIENILNPSFLSQRIEEIEVQESAEGFWDDVSLATQLGIEKNRISTQLETFESISQSFYDTKELYELSYEEQDHDTMGLLYEESHELKAGIEKTEIEMMLSNKEDHLNAIVTIHPGAGGTESQDWASMLYRMYLRWAQRESFRLELLDYQEGEEAGIKDVSFLIKGENAYGYLKTENGIHRLVRISPFDSNAKRHTSFASVMVSPEINDDIDIVIEDKDLRIDTYRASGAGGQHVNKTESAIRITHLPTNLVVQCQNDRSQHKNKATAIKMLKSRLYELELEKQMAQKQGIEKSEIGWGHQIRSYVMQPYQQVKDNRSNKGYSNVEAILDGDITELLEDVLIAQQTHHSSH